MAQYACARRRQLGAVVTLSDSSGYIHDPEEHRPKLEYVMELKISSADVNRTPAPIRRPYYPGERPWGVKCDIAMPCATQNELNGDRRRRSSAASA